MKKTAVTVTEQNMFWNAVLGVATWSWWEIDCVELLLLPSPSCFAAVKFQADLLSTRTDFIPLYAARSSDVLHTTVI